MLAVACVLAFALVVGSIFAISKADKPNIVVIKGPNDPYEYEAYTLPNGLEVLLVSVPGADRAAAALSVKVGSWSDPKDVLGLAHFCEHAVFLGSEAFPSEDGYDAWLSEHGGSYNAYTSDELTNYYFTVNADDLDETLARFAPFFISPLFKENSLSREMRAVDSEHTKNLLDDGWRFRQVRKSLAKPESAYHKFGTGTLETLNQTDIRDRLLAFHTRYYSANVMKLVMYGRESISELMLLAAKHFEKVPNNEVQKPEFDVWPFEPSPRNLVKMRPSTGQRSLTMAWPLLPIQTLYASDPAGILTYLLGHESEGSVLFLLKEKGWATALSCGTTMDTASFALLEVTIELTEVGLDEVTSVTAAVFSYIRMLSSVSDAELKRVWDEHLDVYNIGFIYSEYPDPEDFVTDMSALMHERPAELLLSPTSMFVYDAFQQGQVLQQLTVYDVMVEVVSPTFTNLTRVEPWYGTEFDTETVPEDVRSVWQGPPNNGPGWASPFLHLPTPNTYLPTNFNLLEATESEPIRVDSNTTGMEVWLRPDPSFNMPRIELYFQLVTPVVEASIEQRVSCELLLGLFDDAFASQRYQMQLAGSDVTINIDSTRGLELAVSGYSDSVGVVLKRALSMLTELMASELGRLDFVRQQLLRSLQDDYTSQAAYQHAVESARLWLMPHRYATPDKISLLRNTTAPNVKTFSASLMSSLFLTSMAYGNVNKSDAIDWTQKVASSLGFAPRSKAEHPKWPVVKLRAGVTHLVQLRTVQKEDENNVIFSFYQVGPVADRGATLHLMLLASVMKEPGFDTLRTKQGLGYTVFSGVLEMRGVAGFYVLAQGAAMDASRMDDAAHAFVQDFESTLKAMSKADIGMYIEALRGELEQSPLSLDEAAADAWGEIATGQYRFDHVERDIATLNSITKISLLAFYREHLAVAGTSFRKLSVEVFGKGDTARLPDHATPNNTVLLTVDGGEDVLGWQAAQDAFPLVWGVNT